MNRYDLTAFESFMQEMAECYDRRPYGKAALAHWVDALADFHWEKVKHKLTVWRDSKTKPPAIADIVLGMRDAFSDELERRAIEDKKALARTPTPVTPHGIACLAKIKATLANPRKPGKWWAYELRDMERAGRVLGYAQRELAMRACGSDWNTSRPYNAEAQPERQPGEDDE